MKDLKNIRDPAVESLSKINVTLGITKEKQYIILMSIFDIGGNGTKKDVLDNISNNKYIVFKPDDLKLKSNRNELKWRNDLAFTRKNLVSLEYIDDSLKNDWKITLEGLDYLYELTKHISQFGFISNKLTNTAIDRATKYCEEKRLVKEKKLEAFVNKIGDKELTTEYERFIKARRGHDGFKKKLLQKGAYCKICGINEPTLLIGSHIKPWSKSNDEERLDENNGFLLCPNHDALFDKGYITFNTNGQIIISKLLNKTNYDRLDINSDIKIEASEQNKYYLDCHRKLVFKK